MARRIGAWVNARLESTASMTGRRDILNNLKTWTAEGLTVSGEDDQQNFQKFYESNPECQLNVRISEQVEKLVDKKRIELTEKLGAIPSRSDVVRFALEAYLGVDLSEWEADGRRAPSK